MRENPQILSVDDDDNDAFLLRSALRAKGFAGTVNYAMNGEEAIAHLEAAGEAGFPHLVLLDLKMPRMNGLEVLQWMRAREETRDLPVVMFTSSDHREDIRKAYAYGANYYVVKPAIYDDLTALVDRLREAFVSGNGGLKILCQSPAYRPKPQ